MRKYDKNVLAKHDLTHKMGQDKKLVLEGAYFGHSHLRARDLTF